MALSLEQIRRTADRVAASQGLAVVEVEYLGGSKNRVLRVFIEKNPEERARRARESAALGRAEPLQGEEAPPAQAVNQGVALDRLAWVTHEDCERFSRDFGAVLDVEDLAPGAQYTLEVSSPGLDRQLTTAAEYERFCGSLVKIQTFAPVMGNRRWQGRLAEVKDKGMVLDLTAGRQTGKKRTAEQTLEIAFANVEKANLVPEF